MMIHINDVMVLARQHLGEDPLAAPFSDPIVIEFRPDEHIDETITYEIPGIGDLNVELDLYAGIVSLEILT